MVIQAILSLISYLKQRTKLIVVLTSSQGVTASTEEQNKAMKQMTTSAQSLSTLGDALSELISQFKLPT